MQRGDYVTHNTFPPVEGYVSIIQSMPDGDGKIAVLYQVGLESRLFWDRQSTWNIVEHFNTADYVIEDSSYNCSEVDNNDNDIDYTDIGSGFIDVEFREVCDE